MSTTETFVNFKTQFLLLAKEANVPLVLQCLDLYNKLIVELQSFLVLVLSILFTFNTLYTRALEVN